VIVDLLGQPGLDSIEQVAVHNGRLRAGEDVALEGDFSDIKPVTKKVCE
jgi:hypothetical protein